MSRVLECSALVSVILTKVKKDLKKYTPFLAIISFNKSTYCKLLIGKCLELDIHFKHYKLDNPSTKGIISLIDELNKDNEITAEVLA